MMIGPIPRELDRPNGDRTVQPSLNSSKNEMEIEDTYPRLEEILGWIH